MVVRREALVMKLSEAVDYYLTTCRTEGLSPRTVEWYRRSSPPSPISWGSARQAR